MHIVQRVAHDIGLGSIVAAAVFGIVRSGLLVAPPGKANKRSWARAHKMSPTFLVAVALLGVALVVASYL